MEKNLKRYSGVVGLLLVIVMLVSMFPLASFASDVADENTPKNQPEQKSYYNTFYVESGTPKSYVMDRINDTNLFEGSKRVYPQQEWICDDYDENTLGTYDFTNEVGYKIDNATETYPAKMSVKVVKSLAGKTLGELFKDDEFAKYVFIEILGKTTGEPKEYILESGDTNKFLFNSFSGANVRESLVGLNKYNIRDLDGVEHFIGLTSIKYDARNNTPENRLKEIPEGIVSLKNLIEINFANNEITEIPEFMLECGFISSSVSLADNKLTKGMENLYNMTSLKTLNLRGNEFRTVPEGIGNMKGLKSLYLFGNGIEELPSDLFTEEMGSHLTLLALANNKITSIEGAKNLVNLKTFTLANNSISDFTPLASLVKQGGVIAPTAQVKGQIIKADSIKIPMGATTAAIDIKNYEYKYSINANTQGSEIKVYPKLETTIYYNAKHDVPQFASPADLNVEEIQKDAVVVDREGTDTTLNFPIHSGYVHLRMSAPKVVNDNSGELDWNSYDNGDITYIIPVEYVDGDDVNGGDGEDVNGEDGDGDDVNGEDGDGDDVNGEDGDEEDVEGQKADPKDKVEDESKVLGTKANPKKVLGKEAKTADSMKSISVLLIAALISLTIIVSLLAKLKKRGN